MKVFRIGKEVGKKIIQRLGHTLLNEHEKRFDNYWTHTFGPPSSLLELLGKDIGPCLTDPTGRLRVGQNYNNEDTLGVNYSSVHLLSTTRQSLYI